MDVLRSGVVSGCMSVVPCVDGVSLSTSVRLCGLAPIVKNHISKAYGVSARSVKTDQRLKSLSFVVCPYVAL